MSKVVICDGPSCEYFREYYAVEKIGKGTNCRPLPHLPTDKYCKHPVVFKANGDEENDKGVLLNTMRKCPKI